MNRAARIHWIMCSTSLVATAAAMVAVMRPEWVDKSNTTIRRP